MAEYAPRARLVRLVSRILLAVSICVVLVVAVAHTPWVQDRVGARALDAVRQLGIDARAAHIRYNLLTLQVHADDVSLARADAASEPPFARVKSVDVTLPWSIIGGPLAIQSIQLNGARIALVRRADGSINWPSSSPGSSGSSATPFPIGSLTAHEVAFGWRDETLDATVDVSDASLDLAPGPHGATGALTLVRPAHFAHQGHETSIGGGAQLTWNGTRLTIDTLHLESPEAAVRTSGTIDLLSASPQVALAYEGNVQLAALAPWLALDPRPSGAVGFRGRAAGALSDPRAEAVLTGADVKWHGVSASYATAALKLDARGIDFDRVAVRVADGRVEARGHVAFGEDGAGSGLTAEWNDVDGGLLQDAFGGSSAVPIATRLSGRAAASWTAWRATAMSVSADATMRADGGGGQRLGLAGSMSVRASDGSWRATIDDSVEDALRLQGTIGGQLSDTFPQTTIAGEMVATSEADRLWAALRKSRLVPADTPPVAAGGARANVAIAGTLAAPTADVDLAVAGWQQGPAGAIDLDSRIAVNARQATIEHLSARIGRNTLDGAGSVSFADGRLDGRVNATIAAINDVVPRASATLNASGTLVAAATIGGRWSAPLIDGSASGQHLEVAGQQADRVDAAFAIRGATVRVDRLQLAQADGSLIANGSYNLNTRALDLVLNANNVAVAPIPGDGGTVRAPVRAHVDAALSASGTVDDPHGQGRIDVRDALWKDLRLGRVSATLTLADHRITSAVEAPDLFASATGSISTDPHGSFAVDAQVADANLADLAARLGVPADTAVTGRATFIVRLDGRLDRLTRPHATIDLRQLDASVDAVPVRATQAARAVYDERSLEISDLVVDVGGSHVRAGGRLDQDGAGTLTASLDGTLRELAAIAKGFDRTGRLSRAELDGRVNVAARLTGRMDRPDLEATLRLADGSVTAGSLPPVTRMTALASYGEGVLDLSQLTGVWQGATLSARGQAPLAMLGDRVPAYLRPAKPRPEKTARIDARFGSITPQALAPWVSADTLRQLNGLISGTLTLEADAPTVAALRGQIELDNVELAIAGVKFDERRPTRLELAKGRLQIADWEWGAGENRLSVAGSVPLDTRSAIDVTASGALDLRALGAFSTDVSTAGQATFEARVTGPLSAPRVNGRADILNGELRAPAAGLIVSDVAGRIALAGDEVSTTALYGTANGGTLAIAGRARYASGGASGRLAITGRGIAMAIPLALRSEVDADLSLAIDNNALSLSGDVTMLRAAYREPLSLTGGLLEALQRPPVTIESESASLIDRMALDVRLTTAEDIVVDNNYARLAIGADLRVRGTPARPSLLGRAEAREGGRIFLGANSYRLERSGTVDFVNPTRIEPDFNITAATRVARYDVDLSLKGPLSRLETRLSSPGTNLTEGQIAVLLATGILPTQGGSIFEPSLEQQTQLLAYVTGEFLGTAGRAVGVDTLRLQQGNPDVRFDAGLIATETDPARRLTFGKQVTRQFEVIFSKNLDSTGAFMWIIGYRPRPNFEIRVVSQDNNDRIYGFRHDITIGGTPARALTPPAPRLRIVAVRVAGDSTIPDDELRSRLKLTAGKRFDFDTWQQDRERLETMCRDRGRLEAHVNTKRADVERDGAPGVELDYDVRCGPATAIEITGAPDESALRRGIERVWSSAVFDTVLVDETRGLARAALVKAGYLRPTIAVAMDVTDERKRLVVTIDAGDYSDRRRVAFNGNAQMPTDRLVTVASPLEETAWSDPVPLTRAVTTLYRNEGFLAAKVAVGEPLFDGGTATLPVTIDEGPAFRIASVNLSGMKAETPAALLPVVRLEPGRVLTRADLDAAAAAIESHYLARGFGYVRVTIATRTEPSPALVTVTATIDEGVRQVVRDVTIDGTRRTTTAFVSRELRIAPGQPVNLSDWAQARKRLFDSGAYRQVDVEAVPITDTADTPAADRDSGDQPVRARVSVEEWPPLRFRYGFELDEHTPAAASFQSHNFRPGVAADATFHNLVGPLSLVLAGRYTNDFRAARGLITAPVFFGLPLTSNLFLERSREDVGSSERPFNADKTTFTAEQRFRLRSRLQIAYSYSYERNHTYDLNAKPDDPFAFDITANVARLTTTGIRDSRDDLVDATQGQFFSATLEHGGSAIGSDLHFTRFFAEQSYYRTLPHRLVFATNGRLGLATAYEQELLPGERFFAGGGNSVRGYDEGALGPRDGLGDPVGGNALLVLNEELRFPIAWWVRGVAFFDAGNTFASVSDISLSDLRSSAGAGVRVRTPFALFRLDIGAPLGRRPGEPRTSWFFSIGQVF